MKRITLTPRKKPVQKRAMQMEQDILEGAIRVLRKHGAFNFTTIKVAEQAGVSVGSIYQFFPNKQAILFRLHEMEWNATWEKIESALRAPGKPWHKLENLIVDFFHSEQEEATLRLALDDTGSYFRSTTQYRALQERVHDELFRFLKSALPAESVSNIKFKTRFLITTLTGIAEKITSQNLSESELKQWARFSAKWLVKALRSPA